MVPPPGSEGSKDSSVDLAGGAAAVSRKLEDQARFIDGGRP